MSADFLWPPNNGGRVRSMAQLGVLASLPEVERISVFCMCEEKIDHDRRQELHREVPKLEILIPASAVRAARGVAAGHARRAVHGRQVALARGR
jgi:hypothetical protein